MMRRYKSPAIARKVLWLILNHKHPETMIGDFEEIYNDIARENGHLRAKIWYWSQIFFTLPSFVKNFIYWGLTMFVNYLKIAIRVIKKHRVFSFINISGLAVGMACCFFILLWIQDELNYDKFHENYNEIYRLTMNFEGRWSSQTPWALAPTLKSEYPEIISFTRYRSLTLLVANEKNRFYESAVLVDPDFFNMFTFPIVNGDATSPFPNLDSAVITESMAKKYFGKEDPLGKVLTIDDRFSLFVTAILKDLPANSHFNFDILVPVQRLGEDKLKSWAFEAESYVLLEGHTSPHTFREKISGIIMKYDKRANQTMLASIQPLSRIHLYSLTGGGNIIYIIIFSMVAVFILILACMNFINLSTARGSTRAQEVGMRKVIGARRSQIIRQFFGESILLSFIALLLAVILVNFFLPVFNNLTQKNLTFNPINYFSMFLSLVAILVITSVVSGSYPALFLSAFHPVKVLKGSLSSGSCKPLLRKVLVVFHFTVTISLVIATSMIFKQLNFVRNKKLGFNRQHVISLPFDSAVDSSFEAFKNEILQSTSVVQVTAASSMPVNVGSINPVYWEGMGPDQYETMRFVSVDYDYIKTFEMEIIQGRDFSQDFPTDSQNYIVNEEAVKFMGFEDPIGKLFSIWQFEGRIIGVIKNFHSRPLHREIEPLVLTLNRNNRSWNYRNIFIRIKPDNIPKAVRDIEKTWKRFAPNYPFSFQFLDEAFERFYLNDQRTGKFLKYFTIIAIFISCLGILGLSAFMTEQRTKEIGVRKVLGASVSNIVFLISKEFFILLAFANTLAWPVTYLVVTRMLNSYAYRTGISLWIFILAGAMSYVITIVTVSFYAVKAARTNPINSLAYE